MSETNIKPILESAARSPDPMVRNMAIKRMELAQQMDQMDTFFAIYGEAQGAPKPGPAKAAPAAVAKPAAKPARNRAVSTETLDRFVAAARATLLAHGQPMKLPDLFTAMQVQTPDLCPPKPTTFRQRLYASRDRIGLIGHLYWPADEAVPPAVADG